jgi:CheY-like chemotaxis protein
MACIVANDNSFQLMVVAYNLKSLNIKICKEAVNGLEAFQFAQNCRDKQRIDFVLLDLDMPIMDGFEACQQILGLYTSKNQLFKLEKNNDSDDSDSDRSVVREVEHIIDDMFTKPLMVAYSGLVNEEVE